jgi:uncharacterized protein (DUF952 family)/uncharacterized membrane protein YeaQ/YmgE (transglycosylase-associated protein family)
MATIFHLALASDWEAARAAGSYTISTRGRSLAEEGFIHASRGDQWPGVRARFYGDVTEPMVLLQIDTDRLGVPVVEEPAVPGATETFPHIYGPLDPSAVVRAIPLDAAPDERASSTPERGGQESFTQAFFREMFLNAVLVLMVMVLGVVGGVIGSMIGGTSGSGDGQGGELAGALLGVVVGIVAAVVLYRRRARR